MILTTLFGGLMGGVFRLVPELLKYFDKKEDRSHELRMLSQELEFAKLKGEFAARETQATLSMAELSTMAEAFKEQSETAKAAGWFVAALSALVRPLVTYSFCIAYFAVKVASFLIAMQQGGAWTTVLLNLWSTDDMGLLTMILTFWFVGRVWERGTK